HAAANDRGLALLRRARPSAARFRADTGARALDLVAVRTRESLLLFAGARCEARLDHTVATRRLFRSQPVESGRSRRSSRGTSGSASLAGSIWCLEVTRARIGSVTSQTLT